MPPRLPTAPAQSKSCIVESLPVAPESPLVVVWNLEDRRELYDLRDGSTIFRIMDTVLLGLVLKQHFVPTFGCGCGSWPSP